MATWNFLTNHALVLVYIGGHPESTGLGIAQAVGITERAVRKIVTELRAGGYINQEKVGRRNRYRINAALPLWHWGEREVTVGELLQLLWRDSDQAAVAGGEANLPATAGGCHQRPRPAGGTRATPVPAAATPRPVSFPRAAMRWTAFRLT